MTNLARVPGDFIRGSYLASLARGTDVDRIKQAVAGIRAEAERLGRDPGEIDVILRINGEPSATPAQLGDAVVEASEQAGIDHSFVDLMYLAEDTGRALDLAAQVISRARRPSR